MKHIMNYKEFAEEAYRNDPERKQEFIGKFEEGWGVCWHRENPMTMEYKGNEYCFVEEDTEGCKFYVDKNDHHIIIGRRIIIELKA